MDRIQKLDDRMAFWASDLDSAAATKNKELMLKTLHDYECIQRAIARMYNLYSKKHETTD